MKRKKVRFFASYLAKKMVQFFESSFQKRFISVTHISIKSVLWVILTKIQLCESYWKKVHKKRFNSMGHFWKRVPFFALYSKKVQFIDSFFVFLKRKTVQVFESKKEQFILWVIYFVKLKYSLSHTKKWVQFLWVMLKRFQFQWVMLTRRVRSCWKEGFKSESHVFQKVNKLSDIFWKMFNSLERIRKVCNSLGRIRKVCNYFTHMFSKI